MVQRIESRKNLPGLQVGDRERSVFRKEGDCVSSESSVLSLSLSKNDASLAARGVVQGGRNIAMVMIVCLVKDTPSHATTARQL